MTHTVEWNEMGYTKQKVNGKKIRFKTNTIILFKKIQTVGMTQQKNYISIYII